MQPPELTADMSIGEPLNPCQPIKTHDSAQMDPCPYVVEFMGLEVVCRTAEAALDLARLIAAGRESATGR